MNYSYLQKRINILLLYLLSSACVYAQSKEEFALSLMKERDFFRAISIYKELAFFSKNPDSTILYYAQIGKAYRLSQKYQLSVSAYSDLLNYHNLSDSISCSIYLNLGLNYLGMKIPSQAEVYFQEAQKTDKDNLALFYLGLAALENSDWKEAQSYYDQVSRRSLASKLSALSSEFSKTLNNADRLPHKDPLTAIFLSTI